MRKLVVGCSLAFCVASMFASPARADAPSGPTIEDARERWFDADFESARDAFLGVLARADLTRAQALDAHRYLAVILLVLGDEPASRDHADAAVALDPEVTPPEGAPRVADDLFRMARRRVAGVAAITIESTDTLELGHSSTIVAHLEPAPAALVRTIRLRCGSSEATADGQSVNVTVVPRAIVVCTAEALSSGGAVLVTASRELAPVGGEVVAGSGTTQVDSPSRRRVWPWVVVGVAVAAGATTAGLMLRRERDVRFGSTTVVGW